ncbi:hypothetical protein VP121E341_P0028 [Vibrio phage 121E34-1]|nr:hypothetical protein VP121E341_P0028 [Vibrio phage 121E34-1]CAH9011962.1 hypothetical protein VP131E341_P0028 [Vibrio phage 131E34-1]
MSTITRFDLNHKRITLTVAVKHESGYIIRTG